MKSHPLVSIIVTTKNEEKNIANCLIGIKRQTYPQKNIEIIVIDNNSTDRTKKIAKQYTQKVYNHGSERSAQRNFGIKKALGEYILYLDADMSLSPKLIDNAVKQLQKTNIIAFYIPEIILGDSFWTKVRNFERSFYNGTVIDAVRFIKKDILLKIGAFDEMLTGPEDWDLDKRIRQIGQVALLNKPRAVIYHHENNFHLRNYLKKKSYYVKGLNKYLKKWGNNDSDIKKQLGFVYRYFGVFFEKGKWKKLFKHPLLTLGLLLLRLLVGLEFLKSSHKNE